MTYPVGKFRPEHLFLVACLAVVAATLFNLVLQYSTVPRIARYIPPESPFHAFASSLRSVWVAADPHVGRFFRAAPTPKDKKADASAAEELAQSIKKTFHDSGLKLAGVDDLTGLGIDPDAPAAAALVKAGDRTGLLILIPILSEQKFLETVGKLIEEKIAPVERPLRAGSGEYALYKGGDWFIAFPGDATAVLTDDENVLPRALQDPGANLAFFRSGDHAIRSFSRLLPGRERSEAWIKGRAHLPPIGQGLQFLVAIDASRVLIRSKLTLSVGQSRHLQKVVARGAADLASILPVMSPSNMAAVLADPSFPDYFDLFEKFPGHKFKSQADALFPALLEELKKARRATRMNLAVGEDARGVPDIVLGFEMAQADAQDLVFRLQSTLRLKRDTQVVKAALDEYRKNAAGEAKSSASPRMLVAEKKLTSQRHPLWSRYSEAQGKIKIDRPFAPEDFANTAYEREWNGYALRFILPPITDDDFTYRIPKERREKVSEHDLKQDKYRLCSVYWQGTLWFGNDAEVLGRWLDKLRSPAANIDLADAFRISGNEPPGKATVFIHPRQLLDQGLLHPDPNVNEVARLYLSQIDHYRAVLLKIATDETEQELHAAITLLRY